MSVVDKFRTPLDHPHHLGKFAVLLAVLLTTIVLYPFIDNSGWVEVAVVGIGFITILSALWAVSNSKLIFVLGIVLAIPAFSLNIANAFSQHMHFAYYSVPLAFAFYVLINLSLLRSVVRSPMINWDILCGAVSIYLLIGINWAIIYTYIDLLNPHAYYYAVAGETFGNLEVSPDFMYYSFVTLTTLGYGDIVPVTTAGRTFAVLESIVGALYIAVIIGKVISAAKFHGPVLYRKGGQTEPEDEP